MARHGFAADEAERLANDREQSIDPPSRRGPGRRSVTDGHLRSVALLEELPAATGTISQFRSALGGVPVLLRPVDAGLTVMSLDVERCESMISVGAPQGGGLLTSLPPSPEQIEAMVAAYERKRAQLARASEEERFSLHLIATAMADGLRLVQTPWIFVAHEWRLHLSNGSTGKVDLLGFDLGTRRLVVIELKASAAHATKPDPNGWNAAQQADEYANAIWERSDELYPFFDRLIAAQCRLYAPGVELPTIDTSKRPTTAVWWPDPQGAHTPAWPAWNAGELSVPSDPDRVARYRRHPSWWRETHREVAPGPHPTAPGRRIGSTFRPDDVATDRRLNFIDEAAYRHAERRAQEVEVEGGTLDAERLFGNLLSSMPMCFNLFGAVGAAPGFVDLMRVVFDGDTEEVNDVECEAQSPPQWDDRTAFDAQVDYRVRDGQRRFLAVETKYTKPFTPTRYDRALYRRITEDCGWFRDGAADELIDPKTNQLWRGLLLMSVTEGHFAAAGRYAVVAPEDDSAAKSAVEMTRSWMIPDEVARLRFVSLEEIVDAADRLADRRLNSWSSAFLERYLPSRAPLGADAT